MLSISWNNVWLQIILEIYYYHYTNIKIKTKKQFIYEKKRCYSHVLPFNFD